MRLSLQGGCVCHQPVCGCLRLRVSLVKSTRIHCLFVEKGGACGCHGLEVSLAKISGIHCLSVEKGGACRAAGGVCE